MNLTQLEKLLEVWERLLIQRLLKFVKDMSVKMVDIISQHLDINGNIKKVQRLSRNRVHYKLMVVEVGDILMDEDIVQTVCIYKDTEVHQRTA